MIMAVVLPGLLFLPLALADPAQGRVGRLREVELRRPC
jgi:hypothetical protein